MIRIIKKHPVISFFVLTYLINWLGMAGHVAGVIPALGEWPVNLDGHLVAVFRGRRTLLNWSPNIAAIIVLGVTQGWPGVRVLFRRFLVWRIGRRAWLRALGLPAVMASAAIGLHVLCGGKTDLAGAYALPAVFLLRNIFSLSTGGIGEEAGWRGYALPELQRQWGAGAASLVIGLAWGGLHAPMWAIRGWGLGEIGYYMVTVVCLSFLLTWIYNTTSRTSLLAVAVAHNLFNALDASLSSSYAAVIAHNDFMRMFTFTAVIVTIIVIIRTRGDLGAGDEKGAKAL